MLLTSYLETVHEAIPFIFLRRLLISSRNGRSFSNQVELREIFPRMLFLLYLLWGQLRL